MSRNILAGDSWVVFNFADPNKRYAQHLKGSRPIHKTFIENIVLYDQVVVPTQDFLSAAALIQVLGADDVLDLLHRGILRFVRVKGSLAYVGNGHGLTAYAVQSSEERPRPFCAPMDEALQWALNGLNSSVDRRSLTKALTQGSHEIDLSRFADTIRHETYTDILQSEMLRNTFSVRNSNLDRLQGVGPDQIRIYGGPLEPIAGDEINALLMLAHANTELRLAEAASCEDLSSSGPIGHVLKAKADRCFQADGARAQFTALVEVAGIPDFPEAVLGGHLSVKKLVRLRETRDGAAFRTWFHTNCRGSSQSVAREYVKLLEQIPTVQSMPARLLRFLVTNAAGLVPVVGVAVSAIDTFLVDLVARGASPKFFLTKLSETAKS